MGISYHTANRQRRTVMTAPLGELPPGAKSGVLTEGPAAAPDAAPPGEKVDAGRSPGPSGLVARLRGFFLR